MDEWDEAQEHLYESIFDDHPFVSGDEYARELFDDAFFEGARGLEYEYAVDSLEVYLWEEYGIELDDDFWEDFRDWYDSQ